MPSVDPSYIPSLFTGAFALGGVLIGLFFSSLERARERRMALRRDVYLQASEAMANYQHYLGKFAHAKLANEEHRAFLDNALPAFKRIHVVASFHTIKKYDSAFLFMIETSYELGSLRYERDLIDSKLRSLDSEIDALKSQKIARKSRKGLANRFPDEAGGPNGQLSLNSLLEGRAELADDWRRSHRTLQEAASRADLEFRKYLAQALLASRREMGLKLPEGKYMEMISDGSLRIGQAFNRAIERRKQQPAVSHKEPSVHGPTAR